MRVTYDNKEWVALNSLICSNTDFFQRWLKRNYADQTIRLTQVSAFRRFKDLGGCDQRVHSVTLFHANILEEAVNGYMAMNPKYPVEIPAQWRHICIDAVHFEVSPLRVLHGEAWLHVLGYGVITVEGAGLLNMVCVSKNSTFIKVNSSGSAFFNVVMYGQRISVAVEMPSHRLEPIPQQFPIDDLDRDYLEAYSFSPDE